jgi:hypothetical protein
MRNRGLLLAALAVVLLVSASPLAAEVVIQRGVDIFTTTADGNTFYDFAQSPIPAGFFCKGCLSPPAPPGNCETPIR